MLFLSVINGSSRQKINKERVDLKVTISHLDVMDNFRIFTSVTAEYSFFSSSQGTFTNKAHIQARKTYLNRRNRNHTECVLQPQWN